MAPQDIISTLTTSTPMGAMIWDSKTRQYWKSMVAVLLVTVGLIVLVNEIVKPKSSQDAGSEIGRNVNTVRPERPNSRNAIYNQQQTEIEDSTYKVVDIHPDKLIDSSFLSKLTTITDFDLKGYKIFQAMKLELSTKEHDRTLLLVMDERLYGLNGTLTYYAYGKGVTVPVFMSDSTVEDTDSLKQAQLLVVDSHLRMVYREQLNVATARIDKVFLYGDTNKPTFVLTKDYSQGSGSYNGPVSFFLETYKEGIHYLFEKGGFMTSLKRGWCISHRTTPKEILYQQTNPNNSTDEDKKFIISYIRWHYTNGQWIKSKKEEYGFWENWEQDTGVDIDEFYLKFK